MRPSPALADLISPEYLAEQVRLHADPRGYGGRGSKWADVVCSLIAEADVQTILDYGCGQATLLSAVRQRLKERKQSTERLLWKNFDPAIWTRNVIPDGDFDLVVCTDVLEHVEPDKIGAVLDHLRALTRVELFTVISLVETAKTLSDGRQAHILLESEMWWVHAMASHGFDRTYREFPNPKPEKQFVASWRPS